MERAFPGIWALVHGLASLHLDSKFAGSDPRGAAERVRASVRAGTTACAAPTTSVAD